MQESSDEITPALTTWDPRRSLKKVDSQEAKLSRGFLRCRPEKWFPAFPAHWLPLAHSLGVDFKMLEVKPALSLPKGLATGFYCSVDDEALGIFLDDISAGVVLEAVVPGGSSEASGVVAEYLARRLLVSLESSWSGPESSVVRFESEKDAFTIDPAGVVKINVEVQRSNCAIWLALGKSLVERLDSLWRRQIRSGSRANEGEGDVHLEIAQLAVPPAMLVDYLKPGSVVDLEVPITDQVIIRFAGKPWMPGRLCDIQGRLGFEVVPGPLPANSLPEGTTRLSVAAAVFRMDGMQMAELSQSGAFWDTGVVANDTVAVVINGEKVAEATLCTFEGRFAITIL
jgi:flagellar motor switch/type III secretory pathway protein FliN